MLHRPYQDFSNSEVVYGTENEHVVVGNFEILRYGCWIFGRRPLHIVASIGVASLKVSVLASFALALLSVNVLN